MTLFAKFPKRRKQNLKFPFHICPAPPTTPAEEKGKVRKFFGLASDRREHEAH